MRKHANVGISVELRIVRVIYRVRQITHKAITKNKRDQVIVTMHASKLKMNTRPKHIRTRIESL
jgi:DNA-directed RNA polymerase subunit E'/Rpb7